MVDEEEEESSEEGDPILGPAEDRVVLYEHGEVSGVQCAEGEFTPIRTKS